MSPYQMLAYELTLKCNRRDYLGTKIACMALEPHLRRAAMAFFFESDTWKRHKKLCKRIDKAWDRSKQLTGCGSLHTQVAASREATALGDRMGPSLDRCTEELAERLRSASG